METLASVTECKCAFCAKCSLCGHRMDEHLAGDGNCFKCKCPSFDGRMIRDLVAFGFIDSMWLNAIREEKE